MLLSMRVLYPLAMCAADERSRASSPSLICLASCQIEFYCCFMHYSEASRAWRLCVNPCVASLSATVQKGEVVVVRVVEPPIESCLLDFGYLSKRIRSGTGTRHVYARVSMCVPVFLLRVVAALPCLRALAQCASALRLYWEFLLKLF